MNHFFVLIQFFLLYQACIGFGSPLADESRCQLQHLDDFTLLHIFDHLNFDDLVKVADIDDRFHHLVADHYIVFKFRIHTKVIHLNPSIYDEKLPNILLVQDYEQIRRVLRHFGHLITSLRFAEYSFAPAKSAQIAADIVAYCSNTLIELEVYGPADSDGSILRQLLESNRQLRALHLRDVVPFDQLQFINANLPNLTSLTMRYNAVRHSMAIRPDDTVQFANVQKFALYAWKHEDRPFPVKFRRLRELELFVIGSDRLPVDLIMDNVDVESLALPWLHGEQAWRILSMVKDTHALTEVKIQWEKSDGSRPLMDIIREFDGLRRIVVVLFETVGMVVSDLRHEFAKIVPSGWHITGHELLQMSMDGDIWSVTIMRQKG